MSKQAVWGLVITVFLASLVIMLWSGAFEPSTPTPKEVLLRDLKLTTINWSHRYGGMVADFEISNPTQYRFKDFEIECTHTASSGTVIDSNTRTVYEIVEPNSTKLKNEMDMGFIHSQVVATKCRIKDLVPIQ